MFEVTVTRPDGKLETVVANGELNIGNDEGNGLVLPLVEAPMKRFSLQRLFRRPAIAKKHARIMERGGRLFVVDLTGAGVRVNDVRIRSACRLEETDVVGVHTFSMRARLR